MTTWEYENELPKHYFLRVEGYNNKVLGERRFARQQTFFSLIASPNIDTKHFNWDKFVQMMPLPGDEMQEQETKIMTADMKRAIQEKHNRIMNKKRR